MQLDYSYQFVNAQVEDDGQGIADVEAIGEESFGLMGIRERAKLLGGEVLLESAVGEGTRIRLRIPLQGKSAL